MSHVILVASVTGFVRHPTATATTQDRVNPSEQLHRDY